MIKTVSKNVRTGGGPVQPHPFWKINEKFLDEEIDKLPDLFLLFCH